MPQWDYSGNGIYFITLVTQNRECNLGRIHNGEIILSDFGKIINNEWLKTFEIRDELYLAEYIIMPNHIHTIVVLDQSPDQMDQSPEQSPKQSDFVRKPKSISSFIAGFKSAINSKIDDYIDEFGLDIPKYNRNNHFFQQNYHDHVIRNDAEYKRIREYIINNPVKW